MTINPSPSRPPDAGTTRAMQKVVIVNGNVEILELLEMVLDAGHYDVVFVESGSHAYSQIRRVHPDLVILCVNIAEPESLQVLTMLKLDPETRDIPVLTYTTEFEGQDFGGYDEGRDEERPHPQLRSLRMN